MKKSFLWALLILGTLGFAACSDDDAPADPEGTVTLNMLDEANGKTALEDSGIYIDGGQNFVAGSNCNIFVLGRFGSLGAASVGNLSSAVSRAAVLAHNAYIAVRPGALTSFPSGNLAMPIDRSDINYIKFWVQSPLKKEGKDIGAALKFAIMKPQNYNLPAFGSVEKLNFSDFWEKGMTFNLSSADFEYQLIADEGYFVCEKRGKKLIIRAGDNSRNGDYTLWLRIRESYTKVTLQIQY